MILYSYWYVQYYSAYHQTQKVCCMHDFSKLQKIVAQLPRVTVHICSLVYLTKSYYLCASWCYIGSYLNWMQIVSGISKLNLTHESAVEWLTVALLHMQCSQLKEGIKIKLIEGQNQVTWSSITPINISPSAHKLVHQAALHRRPQGAL